MLRRSQYVVRCLKAPRRGTRDGSGQSIVEFALALPVFLALLLGSLDLGMVYKTHAAYQEAAQQAVRVATAVGNTSDQATLAELKNTLSAENLNNVSSVTIYDATIGGDFAVTPTDTFPYDNAHTTYVYSPSAGAFVCSVSLGPPPCTGQSYWDPAQRRTVLWSLDRVGIKITYTYKSLTGAFAPLHLTDVASGLMEPTGYSP